MDGELAMSLLGAGIVVSLIVCLYVVVSSVFMLIGLYRLAKREGLGDIAWFVVIPVLSAYVAGRIPERSAPRSFRRYLGLANAVTLVLAAFTQVFWIVHAPIWLYTVFLTYKRYSRSYITLMVVTVLTGFLAYPFIIYAIRNNEVVVDDGRDESADAFEYYEDEKEVRVPSRFTNGDK